MSKSGTEDKIYLVKLDDKAAFEALQRKKAYVVTYGLGSKATLTVSSMEPTHIVLCLQRSIEDISLAHTTWECKYHIVFAPKS